MQLSFRSERKEPDFDERLQRFLFGKEVPVEALPFPEATVQQHIRNGFIALQPGIEEADNRWIDRLRRRGRRVCRRCGNADPDEFGMCFCTRCGTSCVYCRHCLNMGAVRSCTRLAVWRGPEPVRPVPWGETDRLLVWTGSLSADQRRAASDLDHSLSMGRNFLLWAVCGSGKTEIMYPAIEHALLRGGKVVLATPRTDVVRELFPRLSAAFPEVPAAALYAGSDAARPDALLVVATTHQLIHYRDCFDCVFIDEVDAFPYSYDPMLAYAVKKAAKPDAPFAYVSATPPIELKNAFTSGKLSGAKLSRRYHGHPLPEPVCRWIGEWRKKTARDGRLPAAFARWIQGKMAAGGRVLVFVPSRAMQRTVTERLQRLGAGSVAGVDAEDPDRYAKVGHFRENRIQVLVTTTILERGVTVSGVEVAVFGADDPIFDERALVQIAGRVGRSPQQPDGDVVFFHNGRTLEMLRAVRHIRQMNKEGGF